MTGASAEKDRAATLLYFGTIIGDRRRRPARLSAFIAGDRTGARDYEAAALPPIWAGGAIALFSRDAVP